jgi:hypothetical protein
MRRWSLIVAAFLSVSCAAKTPQTVLRNQIPKVALSRVVEVMANYSMGFGAPLAGNRILTVDHLSTGSTAYWRGQRQQGHITLLRSYKEDNKDLALYAITKEANLLSLELSKTPPEVGEEVYWPTHTQMRTIGAVRGWVVAIEKHTLLLSGWFHPGTSGAPILRADGTVVAIAYAGSNWSCQTVWTSFSKATLKDQLECLYKKSFFSAGALATRVDGWN